jgi:hypothetical protein
MLVGYSQCGNGIKNTGDGRKQRRGKEGDGKQCSQISYTYMRMEVHTDGNKAKATGK